MKVSLPLTSPRVLITDPGSRVQELVHELATQGAVVSVAIDSASAVLSDLESRGLVTLVARPDVSQFDLVIKDPHYAPQEVTGSGSGGGSGGVVLVGGGPSDAGLLTLAGLQAIREADVLVCDRLAPLDALSEAKPGAEVIHVGKIPRGDFTSQDAINAILVERARQGAKVVRLKGGDSYVLGRGGEEWNACVASGVPVQVIPGVSSAIGIPALAGIPITHREVAQGFVVVSGHYSPNDSRNQVDWDAVARVNMTVVILMGVATLDDIVDALLAGGMNAATPAASIADGGMPSMRIARARLRDLPGECRAQRVSAPAVTVIGDVVAVLDSPA